MAKAKLKEKTESFEEMLGRLEKIVADLERDDVPLEEAIRLYEEGQKIHNSCSGILEKAKLRIERLSEAGASTGSSDGEEEATEEPADDTDQESLF